MLPKSLNYGEEIDERVAPHSVRETYFRYRGLNFRVGEFAGGERVVMIWGADNGLPERVGGGYKPFGRIFSQERAAEIAFGHLVRKRLSGAQQRTLLLAWRGHEPR